MSFEIEEFLFPSPPPPPPLPPLRYENASFSGAMRLFDNTEAALVVFSEHYRQLLSWENAIFFFNFRGDDGEPPVSCAP